MTLLPMVEREVRTAARRSSTYWLRFWVVLLGLGLTVCLFLAMWREPPAETARVIFVGLATLAFVYAAFSGVFVTADCLSQEKREDTLGLLFLTDLKGHDVVLGKLAATSLHAIYGLVAIVPVLALPLLLGGLEFKLVVRMVLVLLNTLFWSLTAGLLTSALTKRLFRSLVSAGFLIILVSVAFPLLGLLILRPWFRPPAANAMDGPAGCLIFASPATCFYITAASVWVNAIPARFATRSLLLVHGTAWFFLALTCLLLPRLRSGSSLVARHRWLERWQRWRMGRPARVRASRRRWLEINPAAWLLARYRHKPLNVWLALGLFVALWVAGAVAWPRAWIEAGAFIFTGVVLNGCLKTWIALEASHCFGQERRNGTLELLLTTPLGVGRLLRGYQRGLRRQFFWPMIAVLGLDLLLLGGSLVSEFCDVRLSPIWEISIVWSGRFNARLLWLLVLLCVAGMSVLALDFFALCWFGMWQGLKARNYPLALLRTVGQVLWAPWVALALTCLGAVFVEEVLRFRLPNVRYEEFWFTVFWWFVTSLNSILLWWWGRRHLRRRFASLAAAPYGRPTGRSLRQSLAARLRG